MGSVRKCGGSSLFSCSNQLLSCEGMIIMRRRSWLWLNEGDGNVGVFFFFFFFQEWEVRGFLAMASCVSC